MNRNKKLFANSVLHGLIFLMLAAIFLTLAAILDNSNTAREEAEKQKKNSDLDGSLATVQIYNKKRNAGTHTRALLIYIPDYTERGYMRLTARKSF